MGTLYTKSVEAECSALRFFLNLSNVSTNSSICHGNDCCDCSGVVVLSCIHIHSLVWRNVLQGSQTSTCNERETWWMHLLCCDTGGQPLSVWWGCWPTCSKVGHIQCSLSCSSCVSWDLLHVQPVTVNTCDPCQRGWWSSSLDCDAIGRLAIDAVRLQLGGRLQEEVGVLWHMKDHDEGCWRMMIINDDEDDDVEGWRWRMRTFASWRSPCTVFLSHRGDPSCGRLDGKLLHRNGRVLTSVDHGQIETALTGYNDGNTKCEATGRIRGGELDCLT